MLTIISAILAGKRPRSPMGHVESPYEEGIKRLKDYHEVLCSIFNLKVLTNDFDCCSHLL